MNPNSHLGHEVVDRITGFSGVAVGHCVYLSGCNQTLVVPKAGADGTYREGHWFDDQRLQVVEGSTRIELENGNTPGADAPPPSSY